MNTIRQADRLTAQVKLLPGGHDLQQLIRGTDEAAGYDVKASKGCIIPAGCTRVVDCGFALALPKGYVGLFCSRSGLARQSSVFVLNAPGIIDSDYRGELSAILHNGGSDEYVVYGGDRIGQLVLIRHAEASFEFVDEFRSQTARGEGGFGSTGR